jgi:hypothetical protein
MFYFVFEGFDAGTKLRQVCFYTPHKRLREYLIVELGNMDLLTEEEGEMVRFLHHLDTVYSCPSFDLAKLLREDVTDGQPAVLVYF